MTLTEFQTLFEYQPDTVDGWRSLHDAKRPRGDCDDYALTVARILSGSWLRFWLDTLFLKHVFWYGETSRGNPHLMLWHRGKGWTDNAAMHWQPRTPHRKRFPAPLPLVVFKVVVGALGK